MHSVCANSHIVVSDVDSYSEIETWARKKCNRAILLCTSVPVSNEDVQA